MVCLIMRYKAIVQFGLIHECIRVLITRKFGEEFWQKVIDRAGFVSGKESIVTHYYNDVETYSLVEAISVLAKLPREQVWEVFGTLFIGYAMEIGWNDLIRAVSPDLKGFLNNLDSLHYFVDHVVYKANLRGPSFRCEDNPDGTITLHYYTSRPGLYPIVKGIIRETARLVFDLDVTMTVAGRTQKSVQLSSGNRIEEHVIFIVKTASDSSNKRDSLVSSLASPLDGTIRMTNEDLANTFPYHFVVDIDCNFVHVGRNLQYYVAPKLLSRGAPLVCAFAVTRPKIPLDFENICNFINAVFVLQAKITPQEYEQQRNGQLREYDDQMHDGQSTDPHLQLKGQMMLLRGGTHIMYLCSPYVTSIPELLQFGMRMNDMPIHDTTRDLILLNQQRMSDVEVNHQLEATNEQLEIMAHDLEKEKLKTEQLLSQMLPLSVASRLKAGRCADANEYKEATVMFSDVPGFQSIVPNCKPKEIVLLLNELFTKFDRLVGIQGAYKVETVGDSYMSVGGIPEPVDGHCELICHLALGMLFEARTVIDPVIRQPISIRVGIHSGPVVAGVVGAKMPRYCLFGDTVNTASRMESHSPVGKIHCSQAAVICANKTGRFNFLSRGKVPIKGKGEMNTFFLLRSYKKSIWEIIDRDRDEKVNSIDGYDELITAFGDILEITKKGAKSELCSIV